jgi:tRNA(adenine34) deaminase
VVAEVPRHQAFDRFVRVEEAIRAQQKRKARGDGRRRNRAVCAQVRLQPVALSSQPSASPVVLWPRMNPDQLMAEAVAQARLAKDAGEVPIGAVVAIDLQIVGRGFNHPIGAVDPTAHAEVAALRDAAARAGNYQLTGAMLCVTIEPCLMCVGAMVHARIGTLVWRRRAQRRRDCLNRPRRGAAGSQSPLRSGLRRA